MSQLAAPAQSGPIHSQELQISKSVDRVLCIVSLAFGLLHTWMGRNSMNVDGISYLDVGDAFIKHNWPVAVNAWWSPLYPWLLGIVINTFKPTPRWEFPLVQAFNFVVFVFALLAFRFFLKSLLRFLRGTDFGFAPNTVDLPVWSMALVGYALFLWVSLEVLTLYDVSPDLAVSAFIYFTAGALLRLRQSPTLPNSLVLGLSLGMGYWTKAIFFPLGIVNLVLAFVWGSSTLWRRRIAQATLVFVCLSVPLIALLSLQKERLTFGDSGRVNYAWAMSDAPKRNFQGESSDSGRPIHPTRLVLRQPPLFEFDGPVRGTYPPWTDPSYWNEGLQVHFDLRRQLQVLVTTIPSEARLLLRSRPEVLAGLLALALVSGSAWLARLRQLCPLVAMQIVGMAAYVPIIENDRYLGGFVLALFILLFASTRLPASDRRIGVCVVVAMCIAMILGTLDWTVRIATNHLAIPGVGPASTTEDVIAAEQLWKLGKHPGDKVAIVGDGTGAYWARLGRYRIVAEVMGMGHGAEQFWASSDETRQAVYKAFAAAHASFVVSTCSDRAVFDQWQRLSMTSFCVRDLRP